MIVFISSIATSTTTPAPTVVSAAWTFDQTVADTYGIYTGAFINGATYSTNVGYQPLIGNGRALFLSTANQSFLVSNPFFNLTYRSFTIEAWVYPTDITGDRGIFTQCACTLCLNQCFHLIIRSGRLYADFNFNGVIGSSTMTSSTWYHIGFVYDYDNKQQILYLNGKKMVFLRMSMFIKVKMDLLKLVVLKCRRQNVTFLVISIMSS